MRRIIVDSGSSIKAEEKEKYGVDILPIRLQMGEESFFGWRRPEPGRIL